MQKHNSNLVHHLYSGQQIAIGGMGTKQVPKKLLREVLLSEVNDLSLVAPTVNPSCQEIVDLIQSGKVRKLITSEKGFESLASFLDEIEVLPLDVLAFKLQAGADRIPGIALRKEYVVKYRTPAFVQSHQFVYDANMDGFYGVGDPVLVVEPSIRCDVSLVYADRIDLDLFHCSWDAGVTGGHLDMARCGGLAFVEAGSLVKGMEAERILLPGQYVNGFVQA